MYVRDRTCLTRVFSRASPNHTFELEHRIQIFKVKFKPIIFQTSHFWWYCKRWFFAYSKFALFKIWTYSRGRIFSYIGYSSFRKIGYNRLSIPRLTNMPVRWVKTFSTSFQSFCTIMFGSVDGKSLNWTKCLKIVFRRFRNGQCVFLFIL